MRLPRGRRLLIVLALPLGLAGGGGFAYMQVSAAPPAKEVPSPKAGEHGPMLALDDKVINLMPSASSAYRYAKVGLTVELRPTSASFYALSGEGRATQEKTELASHEESVPLLLDALGTVVSSHDSTGLAGAAGRARLKQELLTAMRTILGQREVIDVYFTDLVMQ